MTGNDSEPGTGTILEPVPSTPTTGPASRIVDVVVDAAGAGAAEWFEEHAGTATNAIATMHRIDDLRTLTRCPPGKPPAGCRRHTAATGPAIRKDCARGMIRKLDG